MPSRKQRLLSRKISRFVADIVVAADGLGTKSHKAVLGEPLRAMLTGYAVARVFYRLDRVKNASLLEKLKDLKRPDFRVHSGYVLSAIVKPQP